MTDIEADDTASLSYYDNLTHKSIIYVWILFHGLQLFLRLFYKSGKEMRKYSFVCTIVKGRYNYRNVISLAIRENHYLSSVSFLEVAVEFFHAISTSKNFGTLNANEQSITISIYFNKRFLRLLELVIVWRCMIGFLIAAYRSSATPIVIKIEAVRLTLDIGYIT